MFREAADFILSGCFLNRITPLLDPVPFILSWETEQKECGLSHKKGGKSKRFCLWWKMGSKNRRIQGTSAYLLE
jgi:hypothetical protein